MTSRVHHRRSVRLKGYDYSWPGGYFVTICTHNRDCIFGEITDGKVRLSPIGQIVQQEWLRTPTIRPNVELDQFVVMPNHLHVIIIINEPTVGATRRVAPTGNPVAWLAPGSLGAIIGQFKSVVTRRVNILTSRSKRSFWQRGYYEHIIRGNKDYRAIQEYIANNPLRWNNDDENPERATK